MFSSPSFLRKQESSNKISIIYNWIPAFAGMTVLVILFLTSEIFALSPEQHLPDPDQEQRALQLFLEVKCLVCNGQAIESSNTEFSFEMRKLIREKIARGESDEQIRQELLEEFGEEILFSKQNPILWTLPAVFAFIGLAGLLYLRGKQKDN